MLIFAQPGSDNKGVSSPSLDELTPSQPSILR
jgi:hypothetical protein